MVTEKIINDAIRTIIFDELLSDAGVSNCWNKPRNARNHCPNYAEWEKLPLLINHNIIAKTNEKGK